MAASVISPMEVVRAGKGFHDFGDRGVATAFLPSHDDQPMLKIAMPA
ncbi:hypothetical protein TIFTF001_033622 [Ficus carica]|uniref:Uncharacterized protein n=1 Tax=Ficus carica TaxID=3494 RepID=A0AA88DZ46_FICCA|nr:hypothetical protein TIFTF001_033622 [Ficus carica]